MIFSETTDNKVSYINSGGGGGLINN
jgi:hypothetical protein